MDDESETESEPDEEEEEARENTQRLLAQVTPKVSLFKKYLKWSMKYSTTDKAKLDSIDRKREEQERIKLREEER